MVDVRRAMRLRTQLVLLQSAIMLVVILGSGIAAAWLQERSLREAYLDRMIGVAYSVAQLPSVTDAFDDADPAAVIQPIAETVREASDVTYVVVSNVEGIRYSHPNPELIGEVVSTPPDAATTGELVVNTQTGTLGTSWRAKVPVFGADGAVIGQVSVGILESELQRRLNRAGIEVLEARISHLAYAQEIASAMLQRQQAAAIISARRLIVDGAVGMVEHALEELEKGGSVELDDERKATMVTNLLVVLCSHAEPTPVVNTGGVYN